MLIFGALLTVEVNLFADINEPGQSEVKPRSNNDQIRCIPCGADYFRYTGVVEVF